jgi:uncharacterized protein
MPEQLTYPGVYVEEISSGVRPISGVATSITAFVGWANQGPNDQAVLLLGWTDYERSFGKLDRRSHLSYAVYHFFQNGGQQAYVVRLADPAAEKASITVGGLKLEATGPGKWAERYGVKIEPRSDLPERFRLSVVYRETESAPIQTVEVFENLSTQEDDPRYIKFVVDELSQILNTAAIDGDVAEQAAPAWLADGEDGEPLDPNGSASFGDVLNVDAALGNSTPDSGIGLLKKVDLFNILCVPGANSDAPFMDQIAQFCEVHRAFLIVDCVKDDGFVQMQTKVQGNLMDGAALDHVGFYFPYLKMPDPMQENRLRDFPPCGAVAGIFARTDANRGVWKAPAGVEAGLVGVLGPKEPLTDIQNGILNIKAVNCIRSMPIYGTLVWGARTLEGQNERGSEWKYIPVRRTADFIALSLQRGLKWVVFEPNDEPLWAQIRLNVGAFMNGLFRQGAFQGRSPREAYYVKCDRETTTQNDINLGIVNILVGFAPLKPAEFVVIKLQQMAGQIDV